MTEENSSYGQLLYDESKIPRGVRIRKQRKTSLTAQALVLLFAFSVLTYILVNYYGRHTVLNIVGVVAAVFTLLAEIYTMYLAFDLGYVKVYERGIVSTRAHTSRVRFFPFLRWKNIAHNTGHWKPLCRYLLQERLEDARDSTKVDFLFAKRQDC